MGKQAIASKIVLSIFLIGVLVFFNSCKKAKEEHKKEETKEISTEVKEIEQKFDYEASEFYGTWIEPVPGFDDQYQGFVLKKDHTAISVNVDTPLDMKWSVKGDKLTFKYLNDTIKEPDTFIIKIVNDTLLKLQMNDVVFQLTRNDTIKIDTIATTMNTNIEEMPKIPGSPDGDSPDGDITPEDEKIAPGISDKK